MSQDTFARVEKKYVISREQYEWIRQFLAEYTVEDEYGQSTIRNVYYDTPGEEMIRHSIQKPEFKEKVRVRGYGKIGRNDDVFVELKRKYRGIVYKRRVSMPLSEAEKFLARRGSRNSVEGKDVCCQREKGSRRGRFSCRRRNAQIRKRETLCIARSCGNWNTPEINMTCDRTCISHTTA